jgi:cytochrome d ubiquinol oxidase subunit II
VNLTPSPETFAVAVVLALSAAAYALLAGADFGGGVWDLLAGGARRGERPRAAIDKSVTPVWEANHVWLIWVLVVLWTGFPAAFAAITTTLFIPLSASLLGIILRGVGFAFRHHARTLAGRTVTGGAFAIGSLITPFLLGTVVGAVVTGQVRYGGPSGAGNLLGAGGFARETSSWTSATALLSGALFVAACAYVGAIYLTADARRRAEPAMVEYFRVRAIAAGLATGALAGVTLGVLSHSSPYVFGRLTGAALAPVVISVAAGTTALVMLLLRRLSVWGLRVMAAAAVTAVVAGWAWGQYPYLLPTTLSLRASSAPASALLAVLAVVGLTALLVAPGFALLFWLQQRDALEEAPTEESLRRAVREAELRSSAGPGPGAGAARPAAAPRATVAIVVTALAAGAVRDLVAQARARRRARRGGG